MTNESAQENNQPIIYNQEKAEPLKKIVIAVYALQAVSFLFGLTFIIAVIINYVKKSEAKGTWLESHFKWQIRTFWFGLLWGVIGLATAVFWIGLFILGINAVWVIYRIAKGWLRLADGKEMYVKKN